VSRNAEDLSAIIALLGYSTEEEMLRELYKGLSLREMAELTGYSVFMLRTRMIRAKIPLRPRGGPNRNRETK